MAFGILLMAAAASSAAIAAAAPPATYDGVVETSRYISSFDGVLLAVTIDRPTLHGRVVDTPLPVVVTQSRSDRGPGDDRRFYTDRGYVWVAQDRRGVGVSFGTQTGFVNLADRRDAKAVIEWAAAQPFSTGKVVTLGCSNQGAWQYGTAALKPKGLVAIAPACASPQFFDHGVSMNGVPLFQFADKPYAGECHDQPVPSMPGPPPKATPVDTDRDGKMFAAAQLQHRCNAPFLGQYWLNMPRDGWNAFAHDRPGIDDSAITSAAAIKASGVAVLQLGGWFDAAPAGELEGQRLWGGKVILGPWVHGNHVAPGVEFPDADRDLRAETLAWFDHYAKGTPDGAQQGVVYYTQNAPAGREWRTASQWPPAGQHYVSYYLDGEGLAQRRPGPGAPAARYAAQDVRWFDGRYQPLMRSWPGDMAASDAMSLGRTSPPLPTDLELTGTTRADLWVEADAPDANVFAVLEDVGPDGRSAYITDGRLRASWRKVVPAPWGGSRETWHPGTEASLAELPAGIPSELRFDFFPTSYVVKAGHRLRVSLSTSIGQPWQAPPAAKGRPVNLTVFEDGAHPSRIELPVVAPAS